jgi:predicted O-methyltransferase YrrM
MARSAAESIQAGHMCLSPEEGRILRGLLSLSCSSVRQEEVIRVVEIGTLTGLSAHYLLDAFPAGLELWTFELQLRQAELARQSHRLRIENEIFGQRQDSALNLEEKTNSLGRPQGAQDFSLIKKNI